MPEPPAPAAPTYTVQRGLVVRQVEFTAQSQPVESVALSFVTEGKVQKVFKKPGDEVKQGEVIAELDVSDIRNQLRQAEIEFRTAQTILSNTLQSFTRTVQLAQLDVDQAQLKLDAAIARSKQPGISLAEKQAREAEAQFLEKDLERARLKLEDIGSSLDPTLVKNVETSRISIEALQDKLGRATLVAPFDGVLTELAVVVGMSSTPLERVAVVSKPGRIELVAELSSETSKELSVGQPVTVRLANNPEVIFGGVIQRVPAAGGARADRLVRIQVDEDAKLETGVKAIVTAMTGRRDDVLWIPASTVRTYRGRQFVVVQNPDGTQRRVDVKLGLTATDRVEVLDGLNEGDVVVAP
ncbi:MAG: RND transporter [Candidatus Roseilinea sp.]|nr:MAG: RND transporter [Candidatus Roseilinea sp.]